MNRSRECPPLWLSRLIGSVLPADIRIEVVTELDCRFSELRHDRGIAAAWAWYAGQLMRFLPTMLVLLALRAVKSVFTVSGLLREVRFAARTLARHPGLSAAAITTLMLGIGANTAIFSLVDGILLRPLPFANSEQLVSIWTDKTALGGSSRELVTYPDYEDVRDAGIFDETSIYFGWSPTVTGLGPARMLNGARVSPGMFTRVLGIQPSAGRLFRAEEGVPNGPKSVVISYGLWQTDFAGAMGAIGTAITINGDPFTIVGVMPSGFRAPFNPDADIWTTLQLDPSQPFAQSRAVARLGLLGRLGTDVSVTTAQARMKDLGNLLEVEHPRFNEGVSFSVFPLQKDLVRGARENLWLLLGSSLMMLIIASINVANLMLASTSSRRTELAVRAAIGAGTGRIFRQLTTEGALLATIGATMGVLLGSFLLDLLIAIAPTNIPLLDQVALDRRVLVATGLLTAGAAVLFGSVPAIAVVRSDLNDHLRSSRSEGSEPGARRMSSVLVAGQIGLTLALLVLSSLLVQTLRELRAVDVGYDSESRISFSYLLSGDAYSFQAITDAAAAFEETVAALPGVLSVGGVSSLPLAESDLDAPFNVDGDPVTGVGEMPRAWYRGATPGYFDVMGIGLIAGRGINHTDDPAGPPVVVINEEMAQDHFGGRNPVGQRINFNGSDNPRWMEIVGVVENVKNFGVRGRSGYVVYIPHKQIAFSGMYVVVHSTREDPTSLVPEIRNAMMEIDPSVAVADVQLLPDALHDSLSSDRFVTWLVGLFTFISFVLSMVGLYALVNHSVSRRRREMGIRIAVGASSRKVRMLVVGSTLRLVGAGVGFGIAASLFGVRYVESILFGIGAADWSVLGLAVVLLAVVSATAALIPAVRASRVDPVVVLKAD